ncbi:MAG: ABC transporter ATP-binding protein [Candidatus Heimdallarchaeaceae archaeon]
MIECIDVIKIYYDPITETRVPALRGLNLTVEPADLVSIIGPSGAGKTTLIKMLAGLDTPTSGMVILKGHHLENYSAAMRRKLRFQYIGLVNQFVKKNLMGDITVLENLLLHKKLTYTPREQALKESKEILDMLNLSEIAHNLTYKISGGEAMRLSVGVALAKNPAIILADEPTGQLDSKNTADVINAFKNINENTGVTVIAVTHDVRFRNAFQKSFLIRDGRLVGIGAELEHKQLEFLHNATAVHRSYVDETNLVRVPDPIKFGANIEDTVEFDLHPSKRMALIWNPKRYTREQIMETLFMSKEEIEEELKKKETKLSIEDLEPLFNKEFIPPPEKTYVSVRNLKKGYDTPAGFNMIIKGINLDISQGDFIFVSGPSGVGKTTFLNLLAGLTRPTEGDIKIGNISFSDASEEQISNFRLENISIITQLSSLFDPITVEENFILPYIFLRKDFDENYAKEIGKRIHILHKFSAYPDELSAGEKQRAALALALIRNTPLILADEPTANVDSELARTIIDLLMEIVSEKKATMIMCSHDLTLLRRGFRHLRMMDGKIISDVRVTKDYQYKVIKEYLQIED